MQFSVHLLVNKGSVLSTDKRNAKGINAVIQSLAELWHLALLSFSPNFVPGDDVAALIGHYASTVL